MNKLRVKNFIIKHENIINKIYSRKDAGFDLLKKAFAELATDEILVLINKLVEMDDHTHRNKFKDHDMFEFIIPLLKDFDDAIHGKIITKEMILDYIESQIRWADCNDDAAISFIKNTDEMVSKDPTIHLLELKAKLKYDFRSWSNPDSDGYAEQKFRIAVPTSISKSDILNKNGKYYHRLKTVLPCALYLAVMTDEDYIEVKEIYD